MKKYFTIGAIIGTIESIVNGLKHREEIVKDFKTKDGFALTFETIGMFIGYMVNVVLWPLVLVGRIITIITGD